MGYLKSDLIDRLNGFGFTLRATPNLAINGRDFWAVSIENELYLSSVARGDQPDWHEMAEEFHACRRQIVLGDRLGGEND